MFRFILVVLCIFALVLVGSCTYNYITTPDSPEYECTEEPWYNEHIDEWQTQAVCNEIEE